MDRLQELVRLHRMGTGAREVARMLLMSPNTEREYRQALEREVSRSGSAVDTSLRRRHHGQLSLDGGLQRLKRRDVLRRAVGVTTDVVATT